MVLITSSYGGSYQSVFFVETPEVALIEIIILVKLEMKWRQQNVGCSSVLYGRRLTMTSLQGVEFVSMEIEPSERRELS